MKEFILTKENDQRCNEYYSKAFSHLSKVEQNTLRLNWIKSELKH
jgi:hypothetical protein